MRLFKIAKKGFGLLGKNKKTKTKSKSNTDTIRIKPSGKKTETEAYLKNRKKPTTYKPRTKGLGAEADKFDIEMRDMMMEFQSKMRRASNTPEMKKFLNRKK